MVASWQTVAEATNAAQDSRDPSDSRSGYGTSTAAHSISATDDVVGLRAEVQNLRRVMEQIQGGPLELPPVYQEGQGY